MDAFLSALLAASPAWAELWCVWQAQTTLKDAPVVLALLHTLTSLLQLALSTLRSPAAHVALDALAAALLSSHLRALYFHLSCDERPRVNSALHLLTHAVQRSPHHAALFLQHFDFSLSCLPKLSAPPRSKRKRADDGAPAPAPREGKGWDAGKVAKQPTRACYCRLVLAVLAHSGDSSALARALLTWHFVGPALNQLAADPPAHQLDVCTLLLTRVLPAGRGKGLGTPFWVDSI